MLGEQSIGMHKALPLGRRELLRGVAEAAVYCPRWPRWFPAHVHDGS